MTDALVEVRSPAIIERVREARSDGSGRYRIDGLPPGLYVVVFTHAGFKTLRLEDVEVSGSRTVVAGAELAAGSQTETMTVAYAGGSVDARSASRQMVLQHDVITAIPNRRNYNSLLVLVPGVTTDRDDMVIDPLPATFPIHGGRVNEGRLLVDGLSVGSAPNGGSPAHYLADVGNAEEVVFTTSGGLGEVETGGLVMNVVPKHGGNAVRGSVFFWGNSEGMQGDHTSEELRSLGLAFAPPVSKALDFGGSVGGPLARDRVWYFVSGRRQSLTRVVPGLFFNRNAGNPASWLYSPDSSRQAYSDRTWENVGVRVTALAGTKHRFSVFHDEQAICRSCSGATAATGFPDSTVSPDVQGVGDITPQRLDQVSWTSPATDRLLLDARFARSEYGWGNSERDGNDRSLVRVIGPAGFFSPGIAYRSQDWFENQTVHNTWHASASVWAGAHSLKIGYQGLFASDDRTFRTNDQGLTYRLGSGFLLPQLMQFVSPFTILARVEQHSAYVQHQWTVGRLTWQGAARFDQARSWFPEQRFSGRFLPAEVVIPRTDGVNAYTDVTPRLGATYDVFGTGRTAVKISAGQYLEGAATTGVYYDSNPATRLVRQQNRVWVDSNLNFIPNCILENLLANGECGQVTSTIPLGQPIPGHIDPELLSGSGVRPSDWSVGASVEQQVLPRASVEVGYFRRWFDGFTVVDNVLVGDADFLQRTIIAPTSSTLPNGGGHSIGPIYFQAPPFTRIDLVTVPTDRYGDQYQRSESVDVVFNGRTSFGLVVQGGSSTTRTVLNSCAIRAAVPESAPFNPYCDVSTGALTHFRGLTAYTVPGWDVQIGAVYQNKPGPPITPNVGVSGPIIMNTQVVGSVSLIEPGTLYG
ncbi:MAG: carboxypeptidase regulatory-like domain-containing protein, partial [Gammaproteobacteria bacterium]